MDITSDWGIAAPTVRAPGQAVLAPPLTMPVVEPGTWTTGGPGVPGWSQTPPPPSNVLGALQLQSPTVPPGSAGPSLYAWRQVAMPDGNVWGSLTPIAWAGSGARWVAYYRQLDLTWGGGPFKLTSPALQPSGGAPRRVGVAAASVQVPSLTPQGIFIPANFRRYGAGGGWVNVPLQDSKVVQAFASAPTNSTLPDQVQAFFNALRPASFTWKTVSILIPTAPVGVATVYGQLVVTPGQTYYFLWTGAQALQPSGGATRRVGVGDVNSVVAEYQKLQAVVATAPYADSDGSYSTYVTNMQGAGNEATSQLGPDIDATYGGAGQSHTQVAWQQNAALATVRNGTTGSGNDATLWDARLAQQLLSQMMYAYKLAISAGRTSVRLQPSGPGPIRPAMPQRPVLRPAMGVADDWGISGPVSTVASTGVGAVAGAITGLFFLAPVGFVVGYFLGHPGTGALIGIGTGAALGAIAGASG